MNILEATLEEIKKSIESVSVPEALRTPEETTQRRLHSIGAEISELSRQVLAIRKADYTVRTERDSSALSEFFANITLAYRHLEDASTRLGKANQSLYFLTNQTQIKSPQ